MHQNCSTTHIQ